MSRSLDPLISLVLSADEAFALRHLLVWLDGVGAANRMVAPEDYAAQFTQAELDLLAGLRRLLVQHDFRPANNALTGAIPNGGAPG